MTTEPGLRERINEALGESLDSCSRCKVCDNQLDAIMTVIEPLRDALARLASPEPLTDWVPANHAWMALDAEMTARQEYAAAALGDAASASAPSLNSPGASEADSPPVTRSGPPEPQDVPLRTDVGRGSGAALPDEGRSE